MLANFVIGLREGLEAALVVSILATYLVRTGRTALNRYVGFGVGSAVLVSILIAIALQSISKELSETVEPIFAGTVSFLAVGFVTWMIFWMKRSAHTISGDLRTRLDSAALGGGLAVASMAFLAVVREGAETAIFFWAAAHASGNEAMSIFGLLLGLALSVALGIAFYRSAIRINLSTFFKSTGILLALVAAGVLMYGIHEFQEIGWLPGEDTIWINLTALLPEGSMQATIVAGLLNITAKTSAIQVIAWVLYLTTVLWLFLKPAQKDQNSATPASAPEPQSQAVAR